MHLNAIYLVGPKPKPPSIPSRRAFLIAGGTFLAGAALGGACGYAAGSSAVNTEQQEPKLPPPSGDAELDELRRLAITAPIEELASRWLYFADVFSSSYRKDAYLPTGIERLINHLMSTPDFEQRKLASLFIRDVINRGEPDFRDRFLPRLEDLAKVK
jgi:hypothetical protein